MLRKVFLTISVLFFGLLFINPIYAHEDMVIEVTENGFTPDIVSIDKGDTVTFKNIGTEDVWPASDIHPTLYLPRI